MKTRGRRRRGVRGDRPTASRDRSARTARARHGCSSTPARTATTGRPTRRRCCARWRRASGRASPRPNALSLAGDEWALVRAGRHSVGRLPDARRPASAASDTSGVLERSRATGLAFIHEYLTTRGHPAAFEAFVRALLRPLFDELGIRRRPATPTTAARSAPCVIDALGTIGGDPDVVAQARAALDRALAGGRRSTRRGRRHREPSAATHGDPALYDALVAAADAATSPEEQYRYLYALGDFEDPALIERGLELRADAAAAQPGHGDSISRGSSATRPCTAARGRS